MKGIAVVFACLLAGCVAQRTVTLPPDLQAEYDTPIYCEGKEQCALMWERATFYVSSESGFKIQVLNDSLIETHNPTGSSPLLAYKISREPLGAGRYQIWTYTRCGNIYGCRPSQPEGVARAKRYIRTGQK